MIVKYFYLQRIIAENNRISWENFYGVLQAMDIILKRVSFKDIYFKSIQRRPCNENLITYISYLLNLQY